MIDSVSFIIVPFREWKSMGHFTHFPFWKLTWEYLLFKNSLRESPFATKYYCKKSIFMHYVAAFYMFSIGGKIVKSCISPWIKKLQKTNEDATWYRTLIGRSENQDNILYIYFSQLFWWLDFSNINGFIDARM